MSLDQNVPRTQYVFLLGAGASKKAGVPLVDEMTQAFESKISEMASLYPARHKEIFVDLDKFASEAFAALKKLVISAGRKFDVEVLLEALTKLTDTNEIMHILRPKADDYLEVYNSLKIMLMDFIRETCEKIGNVDYLYPLKGFVSEKGLDIFTLNYDGTVEAVCEKFDIPYSDGFSPNWNPSQLETEKAEIRLYKIHGSLFWFKTGKSKYIKLPIKGIEPERLRYFTDEGISETIIYPLLSKEVYTGPFPWLMQKFRSKLFETELCVIIGYSFRDDSIRKLIFEQMENNPRLWLYLINPRAGERKRSILNLHSDFFDRIVTLELKAEDALKERVLVENLNLLKVARQQEEDAKRGLLQNSVLYSDSWQGCIFNYKRIKHFDRIRSAIEEIMKYEYRQLQGRVPIQWMLLDLTIRFGSEYLTKGKKENARFWLEMFKDCWSVIEYSYGGGTGSVPEDQLPSWHKSYRAEDMRVDDIQRTEVINEIENAATILGENSEMKTILLQMPELVEKFHASYMGGDPMRYLNFVREHGNGGMFKLSSDLMNHFVCSEQDSRRPAPR